MNWHPALLSKLSACGIQGQLSSHNQCVALNGILSSPPPVKAGVPQGSVLGLFRFLIFIKDLSESLENPLYLFAHDYTLCRDMSHLSERQADREYTHNNAKKTVNTPTKKPLPSLQTLTKL